MVDKDNKKKLNKTVILFLIFFFSVLSYIMLKPYFTYLLLGLALGIASHPLYESINSKIKKRKLSGTITVAIILLIIIIPSILIGSALVKETIHFFSTVDLSIVYDANDKLTQATNGNIDLKAGALQSITGIKSTILNSGFGILGSLSNAVIGILLMFSIIYYCCLEGDYWVRSIKMSLPFNAKQSNVLSQRISTVIKAVLYGEIAISIIQGILGGLIFFIVGIPNSIFWGFVIAVLAFLPFVGSGMVWIPAAILKIIENQVGVGILLLLYGFIVIGGIDYYLRPKIISGSTRIHPLTALLGAFGGLSFFGFAGLVIGPLLAAIFEGLLTFYVEDYSDERKARK